MKPSEALDNAANIILRDGWWQGSYYKSPDGSGDDDLVLQLDYEANRHAPCCQRGAISRAVFGIAWKSGSESVTHREALVQARADAYMSAYVERVFGSPSSITWNDARGRTKGEVVAALRGAAEDARAFGE